MTNSFRQPTETEMSAYLARGRAERSKQAHRLMHSLRVWLHDHFSVALTARQA